MADMNYTHDMGHVGYSRDEHHVETSSNYMTTLANCFGAVTSLALVAGVAVWGYQLVMRDVSGIPVVRAAAGEMRVRPADPGGQLAQNTGLAVNEIAARGAASGPVEQVILAPAPIDLMAEDRPKSASMVAPVQQPAPIDVAGALQNGDMNDLIRQLTQGETAIDAGTDETKPVLASVSVPQAASVPTRTAAVIKGPGPKLSKRPQLRPEGGPSVVQPVAAVAPQSVRELDPAAIPAGTRLVQLGAFDSPEIARAQWDRMQARFGAYLQGKDRIVQTAESGGRTFYRLRAHGFADLSDARRFCSALVAEGADCIPVVTR